MDPDELSDQADTRATLLPEEQAVAHDGEDTHAEAAEILRESEERVADAVDGNAPADAAVQHRPSEETV